MKIISVILASSIICGCSTSRPQVPASPQGVLGVVNDCQQVRKDLGFEGRKPRLSPDTESALLAIGFDNWGDLFQVKGTVWAVDCTGHSKLGKGVWKFSSVVLDELTTKYVYEREEKRKAEASARLGRLQKAGIL